MLLGAVVPLALGSVPTLIEVGNVSIGIVLEFLAAAVATASAGSVPGGGTSVFGSALGVGWFDGICGRLPKDLRRCRKTSW